jgi:DNA-binding MarR family transcriptional regulator
MNTSRFDSRFRSPNQSPGFLLWRSANLHQRLQRLALRGLGLTPTEFSLLACFSYLSQRSGRPISQAEVGEHAGLDKMVVSDATRALEEKNLVVRNRSDHDARVMVVELSPAGRRVCNEALAVVEAVDARFFTGIEDLSAFVSALSSLGAVRGIEHGSNTR